MFCTEQVTYSPFADTSSGPTIIKASKSVFARPMIVRTLEISVVTSSDRVLDLVVVTAWRSSVEIIDRVRSPTAVKAAKSSVSLLTES
jgi:hypothetical protein